MTEQDDMKPEIGDTVGEFQGYDTGRQAKREALRLSLLDHS